jgi:hypothetical protein
MTVRLRNNISCIINPVLFITPSLFADSKLLIICILYVIASI